MPGRYVPKNLAERQRAWLDVSYEGDPEYLMERFTQKEFSREPQALRHFMDMMDSTKKITRPEVISFEKGTLHYRMSKFLSLHLRGWGGKINHRFLKDGSVYCDLDYVMAGIKLRPETLRL